MENNKKKNLINVYTASVAGGLKVSAADTRQVISATNNRAQYYAEQALKYRDEAKQYRDSAKYYAEQNSDVTFEYIDNVKNSLLTLIDTKQPTGDYALKEEIPTTVGELENDIGYSTKKELQEAVPSQENCEGMFLRTDGNKTSWCEINTYSFFDTKLSDHVLTYEESKGWALQGTYVYKEALAGSRYGYPDFYAKCLEEKNDAVATEVTLGSSTITMYVASNGHQYYDIADKNIVDVFFDSIGMAWFYGIDTENERIFLPRNNYFEQLTDDISKVGKSIEAGLPNITGTLKGVEGSSQSATGAFTYSKTAGGYYNDVAAGTMGTYTLNASRSSAVYGNSKTVQPSAVRKLLYICVGNTTSYEGMIEVVNQEMNILEQVNTGMSSKADGQWVSKSFTVTESITASMDKTFDISSYLPTDGYNYEVIISGYGNTGTTSGNSLVVSVATDIIQTGQYIICCRTRTTSGVNAGSTMILPVGSRRTLRVRNGDTAATSGNITLRGYRRIGTNI